MVVAAAVLAGAVGWQRAGARVEGPVAWEDVSARVAGIELPEPVFLVFRDGGKFAAFQRRVEPGRRPRSAGVDFGRRELVFVSPGPRSSTGYGVEVVGVVERARSVIVRVRETTPSLGDAVQARVTFPYRLIALPRSDKQVGIRWQGH